MHFNVTHVQINFHYKACPLNDLQLERGVILFVRAFERMCCVMLQHGAEVTLRECVHHQHLPCSLCITLAMSLAERSYWRADAILCQTGTPAPTLAPISDHLKSVFVRKDICWDKITKKKTWMRSVLSSEVVLIASADCSLSVLLLCLSKHTHTHPEGYYL